MTLLQVNQLQAWYGATQALFGVTFKLEQGGITTILGANGAGKTTTLRAVCQTVRTAGEIQFLGQRVDSKPTESIVRMGMAHVPDGRGTFTALSVEENLRLGAYTRRDRDGVEADIERMYERFPRLKERYRQQAGTLSGGEQQMLAISRALMLRPKLLLLDEPSFGLAPLIVQEIFQIMRSINKEDKVSMLLVEQNASLALGLADHAYLLETGNVVLSGPAADIRSDESIRRVYILVTKLLCTRFDLRKASELFSNVGDAFFLNSTFSRPGLSAPMGMDLKEQARMEAFLLQVLSGVTNGGIYAAVGLALVMIYQSTHHINFAQGEMATFATYIAWALIQLGMPYWIAFAATLVIAFAGGVAIQRVILRPVEKAPVLTNVIVFIGLLVIFNAVSGMLFDHTIKVFPSPFPKEGLLISKYFSGHQLGSTMVTLAVLLCIFSFLRFTPIGLAMRAAALNPDSARLVGIKVSWMLAIGWGFAAAVGAVAGMMVAPIVFLDPNMMSGILLYGFAAALLGGIDNPWGAVIGGLIVGVLENLLGAYVIGTELKLTVALVLIVAILTIKPDGLFGKTVVTRV